MIALYFVKDFLLLPALFILNLLIILGLLILIGAFSFIISNHSDLSMIKGEYIFYHIMLSLRDMLAISIVLSFIFLFFRLLKKPKNRLCFYIIHVIIAFLILVGGMKLSVVMDLEKKKPDFSTSSFFTENKFNIIGKNIIYSEEISEKTLKRNVIVDSTEENVHFNYYEMLNATFKEKTVTLTQTGKKDDILKFKKSTPYATGILNTFFITELLSSYKFISNEIFRLASKPGIEFYFLCLAFSFLFLTAGVFLRISKWPLFNFILMFFIITGIILLFGVYQKIILKELAKLIKNTFLINMIPVIIMTTIGTIFFLIDFIFIPFEFWKKEIEGEKIESK